MSKQFTIDKPEPFEVTEPSISEKGAKEQMPDAKQLTKRQLAVIEASSTSRRFWTSIR